MKFLKCCGHICVVLNMVVLKPIFGNSTTHIPSTHVGHEVSEVLWAFLCSVEYGGSKTKIWH